MAISIVALRGSIPSQYAVDFKTSIGKYCGFSLDQRSQLADIYKVWHTHTHTHTTRVAYTRVPAAVVRLAMWPYGPFQAPSRFEHQPPCPPFLPITAI